MPTGYTAAIKDGKITTLRDFALSCSRAFGALVMMRDSNEDAPVTDDAFKPSDYNQRRLKESEARLDALRAMTPAEREAAAEAAYAAAVSRREATITENADARARYELMLAKVRAWRPPTPDHSGLADFMREQIATSIKYDCNYTPEMPARRSGAVWYADEVANACKDIAYHTNAHAEEIARCESRRKWWTDLVASLPEAE